MKIKRYSMGGLHYTADLPSSNNTQSAPANTQSTKKEERSLKCFDRGVFSAWYDENRCKFYRGCGCLFDYGENRKTTGYR